MISLSREFRSSPFQSGNSAARGGLDYLGLKPTLVWVGRISRWLLGQQYYRMRTRGQQLPSWNSSGNI